MLLLLPLTSCAPQGGSASALKASCLNCILESILHLVVWLLFLSFLVPIYQSQGSMLSMQRTPFTLECKELVTVGCPSFHWNRQYQISIGDLRKDEEWLKAMRNLESSYLIWVHQCDSVVYNKVWGHGMWNNSLPVLLINAANQLASQFTNDVIKRVKKKRQ